MLMKKVEQMTILQSLYVHAFNNATIKFYVPSNCKSLWTQKGLKLHMCMSNIL